MPRPLSLLFFVLALSLVTGSARALELPELAARTKPLVVLLTTKDAGGHPQGKGTGFFAGGGRVVTNHHVIDGASAVVATLDDGTEVPARGVYASDAALDIAVLAVDVDRPGLPFADGRDVRMGDEIAIIGSPHGLAGTLSVGIVSAIREKGVGDEQSGDIGKSWGIQVTAAISPGSSGSPIMNRQGQVIAVAVGQMEGGQNLNFGVPIDAVKKLMAPVRDGATPTPFAQTGVSDRARNLAISLGAVLACVIAYFVWRSVEARRRRPRRQVWH